MQKKLNLGIDSINKALSEFTKSGLFKRLTVGTYQVNPNIVDKSEWKDIKNIRATFDFGNREIIADIVHDEEKSIDKSTDEIAKKTFEELTVLEKNGSNNSKK